MGALIELRVQDPDATYTLDFKSGKVVSGPAKDATSTLTISDADLAALAAGEQPLQALYQRGRLRVDGDVAPIHRLGFFQKLGV